MKELNEDDTQTNKKKIADPPRTHTQWPALLSVWQVSHLHLSSGPFPPASLKEHSSGFHYHLSHLSAYIWPLPSHSIPRHAIPYLCLPESVGMSSLKHHPGTSELQTPHSSGFPDTKEAATTHLVSQLQSKSPGYCQAPHLSFPGDCYRLPTRSAHFIWTLKISIWWSHTWTVSLVTYTDF